MKTWNEDINLESIHTEIRQIAEKMILAGKPIEEIIMFTDLSEKQIELIQKIINSKSQN